MPLQINKVSSGDLITADFMNQLINTLQEVEQRITNLETGKPGTVQLIERFDPQTQCEVGKVLTMFGRFDFPPALNTVTIDEVPITTFLARSNDAQLRFIVPTAIIVPSGSSKSVRVSVTNSKGPDQRSYLLLPFVPSTVPNPNITSVKDFDTSDDLLLVSKKARIIGENFASNPSENIIKFRIQISRDQTITYPKPQQPPLTIDAAQSSPTQIVVTVPDITEIGIGSTSPATLEIGVGSAIAAEKMVLIMRLS